MYVHASLCDFVCIAFLLPFVLGSVCPFFVCLFVCLVEILTLVIIGGFVFQRGCSFLSFFFFLLPFYF